MNVNADTAAKPDRRIDLAGGAALAGLTLAAYFVGVGPVLDQRSTVRAGQEALAARTQEAQDAQRARNALNHQVAELKSAIESEPVRLLGPDRSNERMAELAQLVGAHGLVVHEIVSAPAVSSQRFRLIPIHLSGRGTFQQCGSFLHDLHAKHRDMGPWTIEMVDNPGERDAQLDFRFDVTWYAAPMVAAAAQ